MGLHDRILRLVQEHNEYGYNGLLKSMPLSLCKVIDREATNDSFAAVASKEILTLLESYNGGYTEQLKTAFDMFVECSIYLELKQKGVKVARVPEAPEESKPDFHVTDAEDLYFEAKALGWARGRENYDSAMDSGMAAQIDIQEQIESGKTVASAISEIAPLGYSEASFDCPPKYFIEAVVNKLRQNIKAKQFALGPTFLICDLTSLLHPSNPVESSVAAYREQQYCSICSGELWNIAFGTVGAPVFRQIEFEGKENICGALSVDGILIENEFVKGILFRTRSLGDEIQYVALIRSADFDAYGNLLTKICNFVNDERNSCAFELEHE